MPRPSNESRAGGGRRRPPRTSRASPATRSSRPPLADAVRQLEDEHRNFKRLLVLFERELQLFHEGEKPDYGFMRDVMHYMIQYPDRVHHPKEDAMIERLVHRAPEARPLVEGLMREHEQITAKASELLAALEEILDEAFISRESVETMAAQYAASLRAHMRKEEEALFPMLLAHLTSSDRVEVEAAFAGRGDPLFGAQVEPGYRAIFERLSGTALQ